MPAEAPRSVQQFRSLAPVAVVDGEGKFYFSIKSAARENVTFNTCVSRILCGLQKTANGKTFRHATPEEVKLARELNRRGWDRKLPQSSEKQDSPTAKVTDAASTQDSPEQQALPKGDARVWPGTSTCWGPPKSVTQQILKSEPVLGPGVSTTDARLFRLQIGRFDVLWREYRARIFAVDTAITEEDVQLYKLLETALNNLQRRYDAAPACPDLRLPARDGVRPGSTPPAHRAAGSALPHAPQLPPVHRIRLRPHPEPPATAPGTDTGAPTYPRS